MYRDFLGGFHTQADFIATYFDHDDRNIVDLLVDQIEFANVIIINKTDLISPYDLEQLDQIVGWLWLAESECALIAPGPLSHWVFENHQADRGD